MIFEIVVWVLQHMLMGGLNNLGTFPQKIPLPSLDDYSFWLFVLLTGCLRSNMSKSTVLDTLYAGRKGDALNLAIRIIQGVQTQTRQK